MAGITETLQILFTVNNEEANTKFNESLSQLAVLKYSVEDMTAPLQNMTAEMTAMSEAFEMSMTNVATLLGNDTKLLGQYQVQILELSRQVPQSATELADGLYQVISAGVPAGEAMQFLETSAKAAIGGLTSSFTAVDAITSVMNSYNLTAQDATMISDKMFTAVKAGKISFEQLASGIGMVAPVASAAGVSLDQMLAGLATATGKLQPQIAITALSAAITELNTPASKAQKALQGLGYETLQDALKTNTLQEIMHKLATTTNTNATFGIEASRAVLAIGNSATMATDHLKMLNESAGASNEAFDKLSKTYENNKKQLQNTVDALKIQIGNDFMPLMNKGVSTSLMFANVLGGMPKSVRMFAGAVLYGGSAVGGLADKLATGARNVGAFRDGFKTMQDLLPTVAKMLGFQAVVTDGATGATTRYTLAQGKLKTALMAVQASVPALLIGLAALTAAMFVMDKAFDAYEKRRKQTDAMQSSSIKNQEKEIALFKVARNDIEQNGKITMDYAIEELVRRNAISMSVKEFGKLSKEAQLAELDRMQKVSEATKQKLVDSQNASKATQDQAIAETQLTEQQIKDIEDYNRLLQKSHDLTTALNEKEMKALKSARDKEAKEAKKQSDDIEKIKEEQSKKLQDLIAKNADYEKQQQLKALEGTQEYFYKLEEFEDEDYAKKVDIANRTIVDEATKNATLLALAQEHTNNLQIISDKEDSDYQARYEKREADESAKLEKAKQRAQELADLSVSITEGMSAALVDLTTGNLASFKDGLKQQLNMLLDYIRNLMLADKIIALSNAIRTGGISAIFDSPKLIAEIAGFAVLKAAIAKFDTSGLPQTTGQAIVEKGDVIINPKANDPVIAALARELGNIGGGDQTIIMTLDGEKIGQATIKHINAKNNGLSARRSVIYET